jgi:hypothetical protein
MNEREVKTGLKLSESAHSSSIPQDEQAAYDDYTNSIIDVDEYCARLGNC